MQNITRSAWASRLPSSFSYFQKEDSKQVPMGASVKITLKPWAGACLVRLIRNGISRVVAFSSQGSRNNTTECSREDSSCITMMLRELQDATIMSWQCISPFIRDASISYKHSIMRVFIPQHCHRCHQRNCHPYHFSRMCISLKRGVNIY